MAFKITDLWANAAEEFGIPGIAAGLGAIVLTPLVIPAVAKVGKPVAKAAIKGSIVLYEKSRGVLAEAGEVFEDLVAEAKVELAEEQTPNSVTVDTPSEAG
ncbi:DUF5132 domain-containing protein [Gloeothece verrucosa]|uniref:DUF5132 domain-containing protein n=1 Tax=Gloeothece verrucosa (strain PCC 7822) TaxID=497965 RepID=E0U923_GLOV7|nr:DUF5132 domain-containing protein [Gloeothece verrucosa]ADN16162.1 conserved hypothetical protein [Gloeothece verrucosa PCC 7822]